MDLHTGSTNIGEPMIAAPDSVIFRMEFAGGKGKHSGSENGDLPSLLRK